MIVGVGLGVLVCGLAACSTGSATTSAASSVPGGTPSAASPAPARSTAPAGTPAPLTGLPVPVATAALPALAVKIDNLDQARPQAGLDQADLVVEEPVEGGLTRLMAVYQSHPAARVGPVRSARISDAGLMLALGGGGLVFSGASSTQLPVIAARLSGTAVLLQPDTSSAWSRDRGRPAPHNLFASVTALRRQQGAKLGAAPARPFTVDPATPTGSAVRAVTQARLSWQSAAAAWTWDAAGRRWLRTQNGRADVLEGGHRVAATNVVILQVAVTQDARYHDVNGVPSPMPQLVGSGRAWVLRNGVAVTAGWKRATDSAPFTLSAGSVPVALAPGTTWLELLPAPRVPTLR